MMASIFWGGDALYINNRYDVFEDAGMQRTDTWFKVDNKWTVFPKHYVYHKKSKVLYNYTPWELSIYIRKTNKASDLYRNFGF